MKKYESQKIVAQLIYKIIPNQIKAHTRLVTRERWQRLIKKKKTTKFSSTEEPIPKFSDLINRKIRHLIYNGEGNL